MKFIKSEKPVLKARTKNEQSAGIRKNRIKNETISIIGKPSDKRFICGAAFERRPVHTVISKRVPIMGSEITSASEKRLVSPFKRNFTTPSRFSTSKMAFSELRLLESPRMKIF